MPVYTPIDKTSAKPSSKLNDRLFKLLLKHPELSSPIAQYFERYEKLPKKISQKLFQHISTQDLYHSVNADLLNSILYNMAEPDRSICTVFCKYRLFHKKDKKLLPPQPSYKAALLAWLIYNQKLTFNQLREVFKVEKDWWVKKEIQKYIHKDHFGQASYKMLLNELIRREDSDAARYAAFKMINDDIGLVHPYKDVNIAAKLTLKPSGMVKFVGRPDSLIAVVLSYVLSSKFPEYNWRSLLGSRHRHGEHLALNVKSNYESNIDACIVALDSLCDWIFETIFKRALPTTAKYGNYGGMLENPTTKSLLPNASIAFKQLHVLRLESVTAHPRNLKTGAGTRLLKHKDFYKIRSPLITAVYNTPQNLDKGNWCMIACHNP